MIDFIFAIFIGITAGWLAGKLWAGKSFGLWKNLGIGLLGSFVGSGIFKIIGLHASGIIGNLVAALLGSLALLWIAKKLSDK